MSQRRTLPPDICYLCLSRDRKVFCLSANFNNLFGFLTNGYPQSDARVCWECRAMLERLRRFKEQAERAVWTLERARTGMQPVDLECLSKTCFTEILVMDLLVYDEPNEYASEELSDCTNECKVETTEYSSDTHVENDDYINKKYTLEEILDSDIHKIEDTIDNDEKSASYNDVIEQENNDIKLKSIKTIDLSSDDDTQSELTIQNSIDYANMPADMFHADATTSSAEGESVLKTHMDELVENAKRLIDMKIKEYRNKKLHRVQEISKIASVESNQVESERINSPISTFAVDALPSSNAAEITKGILETRCQNKELIGLKIKKYPDTTKHLINKNRRVVKPRRTPNQRGTRFECDHCDKVFTKSVSIVRHLTVHFKRFMCDRCGFVCNEQESLSKHMLTHLDERQRPYECDECNKRFIDKSKLFAHKNIHSSPLKCDMCDRVFARKSDLTAHLKYYTSINALCVVLPEEDVHYKVTRYSETITYECNICKERFADLEVFCKHYKSHKMRVACTECTKTFKCRSVMMEHVDVVHRGIRSHLCYICGVKCTTKQRLKAHMGKHSNEKPFKCNECSATFKYSCVLYTHKLIHKDEKRYQCDICEARFAQKGNLVGHMKSHTRVRPFECEICGKKIAWMRNLKNHLKIHSKQQQYLIFVPYTQPTGTASLHC